MPDPKKKVPNRLLMSGENDSPFITKNDRQKIEQMKAWEEHHATTRPSLHKGRKSLDDVPRMSNPETQKTMNKVWSAMRAVGRK